MRYSHESGGNAYQLLSVRRNGSHAPCAATDSIFARTSEPFSKSVCKKESCVSTSGASKRNSVWQEIRSVGLLPRTGRGACSRTGAVWHRQNKCFADSNIAQLAGYGAGGGYFRRYFSECQHAQQNCIRPDVRKLYPV